MCPKCLEPYKPDVDYCTKCGTLMVDYRFCGNPKCKNHGIECEINDVHCGKCGELTSFKYKGDPPKKEEPAKPAKLDPVYIIVFLAILLVVLYVINSQPIN